MTSEIGNAGGSPATEIAFIGGGNMARSLIGALIREGTPATSIAVAELNADLRKALVRDFGVGVHDNATAAATGASVLVLAVKPQGMKAVCHELAPLVATARPLLISIAAGIRIAQLRDWFGTELPIVRSMPNTPALIGAGATGLIANTATDAGQRALAEAILGAAGSTAWIGSEALMDTVTALSGSGPAYFFLLVEALEDAAVAQGMPRETARAGNADLPRRRPHAGGGRRATGRVARARDLARRHHGRGAERVRGRQSARSRHRCGCGRNGTRTRVVGAVFLIVGRPERSRR